MFDAIMNDGTLPDVWGFMGYPPNGVMGGGIILRNLLGDYPRDRLTIVTNGCVLEHLSERRDGGGLLEVPHVGILPWRSRLPGLRRGVRFLNKVRIPPTALRLARRVSERSVILAVPWGGDFGSELFVTAYVVHRLSGAPLVVFEMDEWRASLGASSGSTARVLERLFHHRIVRAARAVWAVSPPLAEEFQRRFGVVAGVMPNCVDVSHYALGRRGERANRDEFRLLYTGAVYGAQAGALRNLLRAIQDHPDGRTALWIYTSETPDDLAAQGIGGPHLHVRRPVPVETMPELLGSADALVLPFSFDAAQRATVTTSLPTKTADYLASGVPVLVHAPPYASITRLALAEGWAAVVDEPAYERLAASFRRLADDLPFRRELVSNALRIAAVRHDLARRRAEFCESLRSASELRLTDRNGQSARVRTPPVVGDESHP